MEIQVVMRREGRWFAIINRRHFPFSTREAAQEFVDKVQALGHLPDR